MLKFNFFLLVLWVFLHIPNTLAVVILYKDRPILTDRRVVVESYYHDDHFDGYHTISYSEEEPKRNFYHGINQSATIEIQHQYAVCYVTNLFLQRMLRDHTQKADSFRARLQSMAFTLGVAQPSHSNKSYLEKVLEETYEQEEDECHLIDTP